MRLFNIVDKCIKSTKGEFVQSSYKNKSLTSYFRNHMTLLLWTIQQVRERNREFILRREVFLSDIEHHFVDFGAQEPVWDAIRHLKLYLKAYPQVSPDESEKALQMFNRIYGYFGSKLGFEPKIFSPSQTAKGANPHESSHQ